MGDPAFDPCAFQNPQKQIARFRASWILPPPDDLVSHLAGTKIAVVESVGAGIRLGFLSQPRHLPPV